MLYLYITGEGTQYHRHYVPNNNQESTVYKSSVTSNAGFEGKLRSLVNENNKKETRLRDFPGEKVSDLIISL